MLMVMLVIMMAIMVTVVLVLLLMMVTVVMVLMMRSMFVVSILDSRSHVAYAHGQFSNFSGPFYKGAVLFG